jgi:phosphoesterase RecJ-like protein
MKDIFLKINEAILGADNILIATHEKPDGDACGSALALALYLQHLGKNFQIFASGKAPDFLFFLPLIDQMTASTDVFDKKWDLVICVDAASTSFAHLPDDFAACSTIINFDHHATNNN